MKWLTVILGLVAARSIGVLPPDQRQDSYAFTLDSDPLRLMSIAWQWIGNPESLTDSLTSTYLRIYDEYIPLLDNQKPSKSELTYANIINFDFGFLSGQIQYSIDFVIGWNVDQTGYSSNFYNITYNPFVYVFATSNFSFDSTLAFGSVGIAFAIVDAQAPVSLTIYKQGQLCVNGEAASKPIATRVRFHLKFKQCRVETIDTFLGLQGSMCEWSIPLDLIAF
jgi:hypothetical protein